MPTKLTVGSFTRVGDVRPTSGLSINQKECTVPASNTINYGDLVTLSSGNIIQTMAANATANGANAAYANTSILGVALASIETNAAGSEATTGRTTIPVAILDDNCEVCFRGWNATASDGEYQDFTVGTAYEPVRWTSSPNTIIWYGVCTATTNGALTVVEKVTNQAAGDDYPLLWCKLIASRRQG